MVANVKTVATQAFQIWMREDMDALGWRRPAANLSGFVEPFDTWADMRQLLDAEEIAERSAIARLLLQRASDRVMASQPRGVAVDR